MLGVGNSIEERFPGVFSGSSHKNKRCGAMFTTGYEGWDRWLGGGWFRGGIFEVGLPIEKGGRGFLLRTISRLPRSSRVLWIYPRKWGQSDIEVYPPAWLAKGIPLERIRFACVSHAVAELKPVWTSAVFDLIVCDGVCRWKPGDWAFVVQNARKNSYAVIALNHEYLSQRNGNIWASLRMNLFPDDDEHSFRCVGLRGGLSQEYLLTC